MTSDRDLYRPDPKRPAGGTRPDPVKPWNGRTDTTRRMARDIYGPAAGAQPDVFAEIEAYRQWVEAGQPPEPEPMIAAEKWEGVRIHFHDDFVAQVNDAFAKTIADLKAAIYPSLQAAVDAMTSFAWIVQGSGLDPAPPPAPPQQGDSRAVRAEKVRAVQAARGTAHGPQQTLRAPKMIARKGRR